MKNPCVNCREEGILEIPKRTLIEIAHRYFKVVLPNGKEIFVCAYHLDKTNVLKVKRIENSNLVFTNGL
jgi:hypothetical protein